jgi:hypothetical protein
VLAMHAGNEDRIAGSIGWSVVGKYIAAGGAALWAISLILLYSCEQGVRTFTDAWVGFWTEAKFGDHGHAFYLSCYAGLVVLFAIVNYIRSLTFNLGAVRSLPVCIDVL